MGGAQERGRRAGTENTAGIVGLGAAIELACSNMEENARRMTALRNRLMEGTSGSLDPSHVLLALGLPHEIAHGSVRLTLGDDTTEEDVDYVIEVLKKTAERLRAMSPLYKG